MMAFVIVALAACQKEEVASLSGAATVGVAKTGGGYYAGRELSYSGIYQKWGCFYPPGNCIGSVEITRAKAPVFDGVWDAVQRGNRAAIANVFRTEASTLSEFMLDADLAGVISGGMEATGLMNTPGSSPERFLKISKYGELVTVYPWVNEKK